jgi:biotin carboxyl carrier protein
LGGAVSGVAVAGVWDCTVDGRSVRVDVRLLEPGVMSLLIADPDARSTEAQGRQYRCVLDGDGVVIDGRRYGFEVEDPRSLQGRRGAGAGTEGPRPVKAPMPGRVVRLLVEVGEDVEEGQGVVVIEAMKMQNELKSPKAGRVIRVGAAVGDTVGSGDVLVVVE